MRLVRLLLHVLTGLVVAVPLAAQESTKSLPFSGLSRLAQFVTFAANRVSCDFTGGAIGKAQGSTETGGCLWPAGTRNNYLYRSGLQVAGIIGADGGAWAGDTTGAFFFDLSGTKEHGETLLGPFLSSEAGWPSVANVPGSPEGAPYRPELRGQRAASDLDAWALTWDGRVSLTLGRSHPLGVVVETRLLGYDRPTGNEDITYLLLTIYNATSRDPATYARLRSEIRPYLLKQAAELQDSVAAQLGVTLPFGGYTLADLRLGIAMDPEVADAGANFSTANVPMSLAIDYDYRFDRYGYLTFDPLLFSRPFMAGSGLVGSAILGGPGGRELGLYTELASSRPLPTTIVPPRTVQQLYRFLANRVDSLSGDGACSTGDPAQTRICYVNGSVAHDTRFMQSLSSGVTLAPGEVTTLAMAYVFAAPTAACTQPCAVAPGNPLVLLDPVTLAQTGANLIDTIAGFNGYSDANGDGVVQAEEFRTVPRSLLAKTQLARAFFDSGFLTPAAPDAPEFFLVPGDNRVTVLWRPSATETTGDPFFTSAGTATVPGRGGAPVPNPLYDPNYRQFDVEGYRVYRGRTDRPDELTLLAQFDYAGTTIRDYSGRINPTPLCAPELGIRGDCLVAFDSLVPGQAPGTYEEYGIGFDPLIQIRDGDRIPLTDGSALVLRSDTTYRAGTDPCLCDTGVPFVFVDSTVRNSFRYFYAVTAFDVNSRQSGPTSMESVRILKPASPSRAGSNVVSRAELRVRLLGRGVELDTGASIPTLDSATGIFSGRFPPANGWSLDPVNLVAELVSGQQEVRIRLDSIALGQVDLSGCCINGRIGIPVRHFFTLSGPQGTLNLVVPVQEDLSSISGPAVVTTVGLMAGDATLAARYGGNAVEVQGRFTLQPPIAPARGDWGFGAGLGIPGFSRTPRALFNGARWFAGPSPVTNEAMVNPIRGACASALGSPCVSTSTFNNAGQLPGVTTVYQPMSYTMFNREWRNVAESLTGARRAADYNVYWGSNGLIDSVIDVTHNVPVPFSPRVGATWGILNTAGQGPGGHDGRPTVLTPTDWTCVEPLRSELTQPTSGFFPCTSPAPFVLSPQAVLGDIAFGAGDNNTSTNPQSVTNPANLSPVPGFALYLAGTITQFGLTTLPPPGTVWSLRDYTGIVFGGRGGSATPDLGSYLFVPANRPLAAVGTEIVATLDATNLARSPVDRDLRRVHTVPDPFYLRSDYAEDQVVRFVNLPDQAIIRIYSASGVLVRVLEHNSSLLSGEEPWDLRNRIGQRVATGVYFYHVEAQNGRRAGRFTVVNYAN